MNRTYNISNSLIKAVDEYTLGETGEQCGKLLKAVYLDKTVEMQPSETMKLGQYFEFKATGATLRDGSEPVPNTLKSGELDSKYRNAVIQSENFKKQMKYYGFEIIEVGVKWEYKWEGINVKGILDILAKDRFGNELIIDLKYSGLLDDKWSEMGWDKEKLPYRRKLIGQPKLYKWLGWKIYGKEFPFYFMVHSSTNGIDRKIYRMNTGTIDNLCKDVEETIKFIDNSLQYHISVGFEAYPEMKRCLGCPLLQSCEQAFTLPKIEEVYL